MNYISLTGKIRNIEFSHNIQDVEYDKAELLVKKKDNDEDVIPLRFKKFSSKYQEDQEIQLVGNLRSYSHKTENDQNKVDIYVFTYFDTPENADEETNVVELDGRVCKVDVLRTTKSGKQNLHFTLANNIISADNSKKINNYIPCVAWGKLAKELTNLKVSDKLEIKGQLHSREYKKTLENGDVEIRVAHEVVVLDYNVVE